MEHRTLELEIIGVTLKQKLDNNGVIVQIDVESIGLRRSCPYCHKDNCYLQCDQFLAEENGIITETEEESDNRYRFNTAISTIEYMIMQHCFRGIDIKDYEYQMGILDTVINLEFQ